MNIAQTLRNVLGFIKRSAFALAALVLGSSTALAGNLTWNTTTGTWDINTTANWTGYSTKYLDGDAVTFNNAGTYTVSIAAGGVSPLSTTVSAASGTITITGAAIGGSGGLTKSGAGTLTLSSTNTYTGTTYVNAGYVGLANTNSLGATGTGNDTVVAAGAEVLVNLGSTAENFTINGTGISNGGVLNFGNSGRIMSGTITLAGNALIWGRGNSMTGAINLQSYTLTTQKNNADIDNWSAIISGTGGLTINGRGATSQLKLTGQNTYSGPTTLTQGIITAGVASVPGVSGALGLNSAVSMANTASVALDITGYDTQIGSLTGGGATGGNVTLGAATLTVGGDNTSPAAFAGVISGTGGNLTKIGTGTLTLNNTETYTGATTINAGTLALGASGTLNAASSVNIAAGATLDVTGLGASATYTLGSSASLTASGTGTTVGTAAATIKGGSSGIVSLGTRAITLTYDGSHPALYVSQGTLSLNGNAFTVNSASPLTDGTYTIAQQASGNITTAGSYPDATGTAIDTGKIGVISVSGGNVVLTVFPNVGLDHFALSTITSPQTAGTAITGITITAQDSEYATVTGFTGTVTFGGTAGVTGYSADFTAGVLTDVSVTPISAGIGKTLTVTALSKTSSATFDVNPGADNKLVFTTQPGGGMAGSAWGMQPRVTALDAYGNTVTGSTASVALTITTGTGTGALSGTATVVASSGVATFSGLSIDKTGIGYKLSAASAGLTGTNSAAFNITPGAVASLTVAGFPSPQPKGQSSSVTVTAKDAYGNIATNYTGTVTLTSSDGAATLPGSHTFTGADAGVYSFSGVTLNTIGTHSITATGTGSITGTQSGISVTTVPTTSTFTTPGITSWTAPSGVTSIRLLVVGGGGASGRGPGSGGGGAGGLKYYGTESGAVSSSYPVTPGQAYTVTVGAGGAAGGANNGSNSVFDTVIATGGGHGGNHYSQGGNTSANGTGVNGGSGGGGGIAGGIGWDYNPGGLATPSGQGCAGGASYSDAGGADSAAGGGGGGAGHAGYAATAGGNGGNGGAGLAYSISGSSVTYAGGGGGDSFNYSPAKDGAGGAGYLSAGGGGKSDGSASGVAGQNGIVIVSYTPPPSGTLIILF